MRRIVGIDPGLGGAIVLLEDGVPIEWMRMPTYTVGLKSKRVNGAAVASFLSDWEIHLAIVEQVGAMPGQGVTSMFTFGHATGTVMGVLAAFEITVGTVTPQQWKKRAGLIGKDKDAARSKALQLWPKWRVLDKKGEGQAMADAALIARFGE
jgi:crossover junction endodeoxyribonuclease RuvC